MSEHPAIEAIQVAMGHGLVDVGPIHLNGRLGLLLHPRSNHIPIGDEGGLQFETYWPQSGDVVIWLDGPELGQTIIHALEAIAAEGASA